MDCIARKKTHSFHLYFASSHFYDHVIYNVYQPISHSLYLKSNLFVLFLKAFQSTCPADAQIVDLSLYKDAIVADHNAKRNTIASGAIAKFITAVRMATMV